MLKKEVADKFDDAFAAHAKKMEQIQRAKEVRESQEEAFVRAFKERRSTLMKPALEQIAQHLESKGMRTRIEETDESYGHDGKQEKQTRILMSFQMSDSRSEEPRRYYGSHEQPYFSMSADNDVHHGASVAFLELAVANQQDLSIPNLALAEIVGVFARQTGKARLATQTVRAVLALPRVQRHGLSDALGDRAAALAASCKLRGADAVFVVLAEALDQPLITLDREILERSSRVIEVEAPGVWVHRQSSG
jgi:predicted nucleic acid-binding protein